MRLNVSKRLQTIARFLPTNAFFADIGTDHAYLPCYICLNDPNAFAIAGDVSEGPYQRALETVQKFTLNDQIDVRLGDGLHIVDEKTDFIEQLVIAGMGGPLMKNILTNGLKQLKTVSRIILQPNTGFKHVRQWLLEHGYAIVAETIVQENEHLYEIIVADLDAKQPYSSITSIKNKQLLFGPLLMDEKSLLFRKKWSAELMHLRGVVGQIKQAKQANQSLNKFMQEIHWIEEVLGDD